MDAELGRVETRYSYADGTPKKSSVFRATVIAKTEEQAVKAVNEQRAQWIANGGEWPEDQR